MASSIFMSGGGAGGATGQPVEANGAIGLWLFDRNGTAEVGTDLVSPPSPLWTQNTDPNRFAASFDSGGSGYNQAHIANLARTGAMTMQALVRPGLVTQGSSMMIATFSSAVTTPDTTNTLWQMELTNGNFIRYEHESVGGVLRLFTTTLFVPAGEWSLIGFTRAVNGLDVSIYINGLGRAFGTLAAAPVGGSASFLSVATVGVEEMLGDIGHVLVDDVERTPAEMLRDAQRVLPRYLRP